MEVRGFFVFAVTRFRDREADGLRGFSASCGGKFRKKASHFDPRP